MNDVNEVCWRRRPDVPWRRSLDAVILFPPSAADAVTLAESGPEIWELLRTPITVEALVTALTSAHHADRSVVEMDVHPTLQRLAELGAIEEVDAIDERFAPTRAATVYTVEVDGEAVLLDEDANRLHLLNSSAALLWACFDGTSTIREIVTDVAVELGAPYDTVLDDTLGIVGRLRQEGLLGGVAPTPDDRPRNT